MLKRLRKNHPLLYCIGAEAVFLGSLFVSSYLVVIALLLFRFNFAYADDYLLGCIQELVGIGVAVVLLRRTGKGAIADAAGLRLFSMGCWWACTRRRCWPITCT